ncbi:hypothetical protein [uncultured Adlercreutzia sp.]|uniref:hypothetical protein n=1 Tax=uncultured Adlercreutzia sp. TaxID=875803 RepID=UPI0025FB3460|nr:hypothetical protein [uncultured Adlercreutzia sp.]
MDERKRAVLMGPITQLVSLKNEPFGKVCAGALAAAAAVLCASMSAGVALAEEIDGAALVDPTTATELAVAAEEPLDGEALADSTSTTDTLDAAGETGTTEPSEGEPSEKPAEKVESALEAQNVYVYLRLTGDVEEVAESLGLTVSNADGWCTVGVVKLELPLMADAKVVNVSDVLPAIREALKNLDSHEPNAALAELVAEAEWTALKVDDGATDYVENGTPAWHLDGTLELTAPKDDGSDEGEPGGGATTNPGEGDDGNGEEPNPPVVEPEDPAEPNQPANPEQPSVPKADASTPEIPAISFTAPQATRPQANLSSANTASSPRSNGFSSGERTTVSAPADTTEAATTDEAVTEEVLDDAVPMAARAAEKTPLADCSGVPIADEEVPMGAFDAPVDPAPWVAGLGAIGTALWGVIAVRRRLLMSHKLASFEAEVLGVTAPAETTAAVPGASRQLY